VVIIPAHSSHILQPLDLNLNHLVKEDCKKEYRKAEDWMADQKKQKKTVVTEEPCPDANDVEEVSPTPSKRRKTTKQDAAVPAQRGRPKKQATKTKSVKKRGPKSGGRRTRVLYHSRKRHHRPQTTKIHLGMNRKKSGSRWLIEE